MHKQTLTTEYVNRAKQLWTSFFDDGTPGFVDFIFDLVPHDDIYIGLEEDKVVSMLMAAAELEYSGKKGFYLYSACTHTSYQGRGYMKALVDFALADQRKKGRTFCVLMPASEELFSYWEKLGFDNVISSRKCQLEIKRNIWTNRDFDIVTAGRFRSVREKHNEENIVHYTNKSYERYTAYLYTVGGSTAESENAYAVYFINNGKLIVEEIFALSNIHAMQLLQAIRERTGFETATVYLPENSALFLGEGKKEKIYRVKGLTGEIYVNLMLE